MKHLHIDISWDETAKYITANQGTITATANLIENNLIVSCSGRRTL
jgi:hypothetical protein